MTEHSTTPASPNRLLRRLALLAVLLLAGGGVAAYYAWRPRPKAVPDVRTEGLDAEVVAVITQARNEVLARPGSAATWGRFGLALFAHNMYADSAPVLAEAERLDPADARWPYLRGLALILHRPEEGLAALNKAAELPPRTFSVRLRLAEEYLKLGRLDEADPLFRDLLAEQPDDPRALLGLGQILSRRGQLQEALAPLKKAAEQPTARRSARVVLAETYFQLGQAAEAEAERRRAADAHPDLPWPDPILDQAKELRTGLQPRIDQALVLLGNNQVREAGALITQALRDHPDSDEAHLTLGRVLIKAGEIDRAQVELLRAVQLNPGLVEGHFLLAGTQMVQKDYEAAERSYLRAVELKPMHGLAHYNLGECRLARGNRAGAVESFRDAVRCRPDLVIAHLKLGELLLQDGRADEAAGHLADAVRLDPANDQARRLLDQARAGKKP